MFYMYNLVLGEILHEEFHKKKKEKEKSVDVYASTLMWTQFYAPPNTKHNMRHFLNIRLEINTIYEWNFKQQIVHEPCDGDVQTKYFCMANK